jgi:diguanylate cyclase (GGDEF)-like protein
MLLTDLDGFKEINDALGHQLGDQVLQEVSRRFATQVPAGGTLARLGGDEMALFVPGLRAPDAAALARALLATLDLPFVLQDMALHLGASIGITVLDPGAGVSRALAKADLAMYRAKESRTGWELYDDQRDGDAWDRLSTVEDLRAALADGGLTVELQPIIDAAGLRPTGMEALVRWNHPVRGRIAPDAFLPLAERAGLMSAVTHAGRSRCPSTCRPATCSTATSWTS